jgi:thiol-disulfide isomerase/thioredoxin
VRKVLVAALVAAALGGVVRVAHDRAFPPEPAANTRVWQHRFHTLDGETTALSRWRGQAILINVWAPWCAPCREEIPDLNALHAQFGDKVVFLGLAVDQPAAVMTFLQRTPVDYAVLTGAGAAQALSRQLGNTAASLPYTILLDRNGKTVFSHLGRIDPRQLGHALRKIGA